MILKFRLERIVSKVQRSSFFKSFFVLLGGNTIAKTIPILTVPILTRIYAPQDFGLFELFTVVLMYTNTLSSGYYEYAIILPKDDRTAKALRTIAVSLAMIFSLFAFLVFYIFRDSLVAFAKNPQAELFVFIIPPMLVINTALQAQTQLTVRFGYFKVMTLSNVINTLLSAVFELLFGFLGFAGIGMILGSSIGNLSGLAYITLAMKAAQKKDENGRQRPVSFQELIAIMKEYKDFPKYHMAANLVNKGVGSLPTLFFTRFFNPEIVGYYALSKKFLGLPSNLISQSAGNVFAGHAAKDMNKNGECASVYRKTFLLLAAFSLPTFAIIFFAGPVVFPILLGTVWGEAGYILQLLVPLYFFAFISNPFTRMYTLSNNLKLGFFWQVALFAMSFVVLYLGTKYLESNHAILLYAIGYSIMFIINIFITYGFAKNRKDPNEQFP